MVTTQWAVGPSNDWFFRPQLTMSGSFKQFHHPNYKAFKIKAKLIPGILPDFVGNCGAIIWKKSLHCKKLSIKLTGRIPKMNNSLKVA